MIKTVSSYSCSIFCTIIIIVAVSTNYWLEYQEPKLSTGDERTREERMVNVGLFERCDNDGCKEETDDSVNVEGFPVARMVLVACYILALLLTLIAFIFVTVYVVTGKYYFPIGRVAICFVLSALLIMSGLIPFTLVFMRTETAQFSWSYGAGWSAFGTYIITVVLLYADK